MTGRLAVAMLVAVLALPGCGGATVAIHSGSPAPVTPPAPSPSGTQPGLTARGGNGLALAIVLGLAIADGIHWAAHRLSGDGTADEQRRPLLQPIDRGWVDRGF